MKSPFFFRSSRAPTSRCVVFHRGHVVGIRRQPSRKAGAGEVLCAQCVAVRACMCVCMCTCRRVCIDHGTDLCVHGRCLWLQAAASSAGLAPGVSRGFVVLGVRRRRGESSRRDLYRSGRRAAVRRVPVARPSALGGQGSGRRERWGWCGRREAGARSEARQWRRELTPSGRPA